MRVFKQKSYYGMDKAAHNMNSMTNAYNNMKQNKIKDRR